MGVAPPGGGGLARGPPLPVAREKAVGGWGGAGGGKVGEVGVEGGEGGVVGIRGRVHVKVGIAVDTDVETCLAAIDALELERAAVEGDGAGAEGAGAASRGEAADCEGAVVDGSAAGVRAGAGEAQGACAGLDQRERARAVLDGAGVLSVVGAVDGEGTGGSCGAVGDDAGGLAGE